MVFGSWAFANVKVPAQVKSLLAPNVHQPLANKLSSTDNLGRQHSGAALGDSIVEQNSAGWLGAVRRMLLQSWSPLVPTFVFYLLCSYPNALAFPFSNSFATYALIFEFPSKLLLV